ncbi:g-protein coupled receptor [Holotrichia oblita]|uniref:G-protein coupled receptor n=1 Tax=Holotrichia oblita TaxID=644536 RepID=A0ACB9SYK0_HOLOL|nr:g-protein coupled receptor [Holotrichia oblita]
MEENNWTISDNEDYYLNNITLENIMGPRRNSLYVVIPITVIYLVILLTGLIGNVSTCVVIARNKSMHTATNYYLFNLAISDLLLLLSGLPPEIYSIWSRYPYIFGYTFCVLRGLFSETSANATVLTITAFTVERYVAICYPFLSHTLAKLSRIIKLILVIWVVAVCFALPQALQFEMVRNLPDVPESDTCQVVNPIIEHSFELSTFMFFVAPMTLITVLYVLIGLRLRNSTNMIRKDCGESNRHLGTVEACPNRNLSGRHHNSQSSRRVLKMLVDQGEAAKFAGKPLQDITLNDLPTLEEEREDNSENEEDDVTNDCEGNDVCMTSQKNKSTNDKNNSLCENDKFGKQSCISIRSVVFKLLQIRDAYIGIYISIEYGRIDQMRKYLSIMKFIELNFLFNKICHFLFSYIAIIFSLVKAQLK